MASTPPRAPRAQQPPPSGSLSAAETLLELSGSRTAAPQSVLRRDSGVTNATPLRLRSNPKPKVVFDTVAHGPAAMSPKPRGNGSHNAAVARRAGKAAVKKPVTRKRAPPKKKPAPEPAEADADEEDYIIVNSEGTAEQEKDEVEEIPVGGGRDRPVEVPDSTVSDHALEPNFKFPSKLSMFAEFHRYDPSTGKFVLVLDGSYIKGNRYPSMQLGLVPGSFDFEG